MSRCAPCRVRGGVAPLRVRHVISYRARRSGLVPSEAEPSRTERGEAVSYQARRSRLVPSEAKRSRAKRGGAVSYRARRSGLVPSEAEPSRTERGEAVSYQARRSRLVPSEAKRSRTKRGGAVSYRARRSHLVPSEAKPPRTKQGEATSYLLQGEATSYLLQGEATSRYLLQADDFLGPPFRCCRSWRQSPAAVVRSRAPAGRVARRTRARRGLRACGDLAQWQTPCASDRRGIPEDVQSDGGIQDGARAGSGRSARVDA